MTGGVVRELAGTQHPAEGVDGCRGRLPLWVSIPIATSALASFPRRPTMVAGGRQAELDYPP